MSWPFHEPPDTAAFTSADVLETNAPVVFVSHADDDGAWQFHSAQGASADLSLARVVALRRILAQDPTLAAIANLPRGWWARRTRRNAPWERFESATRPPPATRPVVSLTRTCRDCGKRYPALEELCPHCGDRTKAAIERLGGTPTLGFAPEQFFINYGVIGGASLMVIAVVWAVVGLQSGRFFFYPPALFLIGLGGIFQGIWGEKPRQRRVARARKRG